MSQCVRACVCCGCDCAVPGCVFDTCLCFCLRFAVCVDVIVKHAVYVCVLVLTHTCASPCLTARLCVCCSLCV